MVKKKRRKKQSMFYVDLPKAGEYPLLLKQNREYRNKLLKEIMERYDKKS